MPAFKLILKHLSKKFILITVLLSLSASIAKGQNTVSSARPFSIVTDTITKTDTIYVIDTIINTYKCVITDTIYEDGDDIFPTPTKSHHHFESSFGITLNQLAITHWAAGGESNASGRVSSNITYRYDRKLFKYVLNGIFAYGMSAYTKEKRYEKSEDRCEISMTMSNNNGNLNFTSIVSLKTQFTNGYEYPNDSVATSGFFAPAYLNISAGYNYNYKDILSLYISPIAGKMTFVTDQRLADAGSYGVEAGYWNIHDGDSTWVHGKNTLTELGINVLIKYKQSFRNNISVFSILNLYNNYMDPNRKKHWNIDVDWETGIKFTINKQISALLNIHIIYDDNVKFSVTEIVDGKEITKQKPILQFKESLGISFLYKFATK